MSGPSLPRIAELDLSDVFPDADFPSEDLENFNPKISAISGQVVLATVAAYGVGGEDGIEKLEEYLRSEADDAENGKFNKTDVWYQPFAPPPGVWDYRCRNCRFYSEANTDGGQGMCSLVGHSEDPFGGEGISPEAWCAIWLPEDGTEFFSYIKRRLEGREV